VTSFHSKLFYPNYQRSVHRFEEDLKHSRLKDTILLSGAEWEGSTMSLGGASAPTQHPHRPRPYARGIWHPIVLDVGPGHPGRDDGRRSPRAARAVKMAAVALFGDPSIGSDG